MDTFKAWLIANMGIAFVAVSVVFVLLSFLFNGSYASGMLLLAIFFSLFVLFMAELPNLGSSVLSFGIFIVFLLYAAYRCGSVSSIGLMVFLTGVIASTVLSVKVAQMTNKCFYELVSLRVLYRTSNAEMFEVKWKYVANRFIASYVFFFLTYAYVVFLFAPHKFLTFLNTL